MRFVAAVVEHAPDLADSQAVSAVDIQAVADSPAVIVVGDSLVDNHNQADNHSLEAFVGDSLEDNHNRAGNHSRADSLGDNHIQADIRSLEAFVADSQAGVAVVGNPAAFVAAAAVEAGAEVPVEPEALERSTAS